MLETKNRLMHKISYMNTAFNTKLLKTNALIVKKIGNSIRVLVEKTRMENC